MRVITTIAEFRQARRDVKGTLGFVPTMGYLHDGHLELVRRAKGESAAAAASIFVNPTQFGPTEDLAAYPRDFERDRSMLESVGCDLLFYPGVDEVYPRGFQTYVTVEEVSKRLEGERRPGHFRGVATVVAKLFNIVQPDKAYFGQKDGQQVLVVKRMVQDLALPLEIVVVPTVREPDGLAMSSRNVYLSLEQRKAATVLSRSLFAARERYLKGERNAAVLRKTVEDILKSEPLGQIDYVSLAETESLTEITTTVDRPAMLSIVVRMGKTRLLDNVLLE